MKPLTLAMLFSVAAAGAACSAEAPSEAEPAAVEAAEAAITEPEISGTMNLNIGQPREPRQDRLVGSGALGSADFGDVPDLGISLETDTGTGIELSPDAELPADEDDDLIRLP